MEVQALARLVLKKSAPLSSKIHSGEMNHRSYTEVVKAGTNLYNTKFKPRDSTTNIPAYDQKAKNVNTTVTKNKGNAIDVVHNDVRNPVDDKDNDTHYRDTDKGSSNYDHSQECKIFNIHGLDDKYLQKKSHG